MSFLPAALLPFVKCHEVRNAVNVDGTLMASVDAENRVCICSLECTAVRLCFALTSQSRYRSGVCFVRRNGVDTLLLSDYDGCRIIEMTCKGVFMRAIPVACNPRGVAYSDNAGGVIAVSFNNAHRVVLLHYESGFETPEAMIGTGVVKSRNGGQLKPTFTADGDSIIAVDYFNHCVNKFSAVTGEFITRLVSSGIIGPVDVLPCDDGSLLVAHGDFKTDASVVRIVDGVTVDQIVFRNDAGRVFQPCSLCYSQLLAGVVVSCDDGSVFLLRDVWAHGSRGSWLGAVCLE